MQSPTVRPQYLHVAQGIYHLGFSLGFFPVLGQREELFASLHGWHFSCYLVPFCFTLENGMRLKHEDGRCPGHMPEHTQTNAHLISPLPNARSVPPLKSILQMLVIENSIAQLCWEEAGLGSSLLESSLCVKASPLLPALPYQNKCKETRNQIGVGEGRAANQPRFGRQQLGHRCFKQGLA